MESCLEGNSESESELFTVYTPRAIILFSLKCFASHVVFHSLPPHHHCAHIQNARRLCRNHGCQTNSLQFPVEKKVKVSNAKKRESRKFSEFLIDNCVRKVMLFITFNILRTCLHWRIWRRCYLYSPRA